MADIFNDEDFGRADIALAPEITKGKDGAPELKSEAIKKVVSEMQDDPQADARNARLLSQGVNSAAKSLTGQDLRQEQIEAISELGLHAFGALRGVGLSKGLYTAILAGIVIIPAIPSIYKIFKKKGSENGISANSGVSA
jgi:hypothetical protein